MHQFMVSITEEQASRLKAEASVRKVTMAQIVRNALDAELGLESPEVRLGRPKVPEQKRPEPDDIAKFVIGAQHYRKSSEETIDPSEDT